MKKILMLGGGFFQIPSIIKAKEMGHYVITCDYLPDNPGHKYADEYYNVSTTDMEGVLELAKKLKVDGVVCYASDPSAPTAAYVSEKMGFPTSSYKSVEILSNKDKFRQFLSDNGFNTPKAKGYSYNEYDKMLAEVNTFKFPVMVKPVDSCGSKGVKKIDTPQQLKDAIDDAMNYSRCKRFIIEEYVEKNGYQIAGDGFSVNGELVFRCFANEHFDSSGVNPFVPIGESFPYTMPNRVHTNLHNEIQRVLKILNMQTQAYNFDMRIDESENVYLMEVAARNGGNLISEVTKYATGVDMLEYTVKAALGEDCSDLQMVEPKGFWSNYMLHSNNSGIFKGLQINDDFRKNNLVELKLMCKYGDHIDSFVGANGAIGVMILKFASQEEMLEKMDHMEKWVKVIA